MLVFPGSVLETRVLATGLATDRKGRAKRTIIARTISKNNMVCYVGVERRWAVGMSERQISQVSWGWKKKKEGSERATFLYLSCMMNTVPMMRM